MTTDQILRIRQAAKNLLAMKAQGQKLDPHAVRWAKDVIRFLCPHLDNQKTP